MSEPINVSWHALSGTILIFAPPYLLNPEDPKRVKAFLSSVKFLDEGEQVEDVSLAGDGNMNVVIRVKTNHRSFILKQSRPYVNKYPSVAAPSDRILREHRFYEIVRANEVLRSYTPEIYFLNESNYVLCMEDFPNANDYTTIYKKGVELPKGDMAAIARAVSELHFGFSEESAYQRVSNLELRKLNHQHIFELPLEESNGFDLNLIVPGLQDRTNKFRSDQQLKKISSELGELYLSDQGSRLLHGDYYPGSWLNTDQGFKMIDPEFCYTGMPEYELGIAVAHLKMAQQSDSLMKDMFVYYHFDKRFDGTLFSKFAGIEIIRRIIGLAQLPLDLSLGERLSLLDEAYELVTNG